MSDIKELDKLMKCPQTPNDYLVLRAEIIHVRKRFGLTWEQPIGFRVVIEPSADSAAILTSKVFNYIDNEKSKGEEVKIK